MCNCLVAWTSVSRVSGENSGVGFGSGRSTEGYFLKCPAVSSAKFRLAENC